MVDGETALVETGADDARVAGAGRPSRSARRIVAAVAVAVVVLAGLAGWVLVTPYSVEVGGASISCDAGTGRDSVMADRQDEPHFGRACDDARDRRRTTALLIGAGVATAAAAVSTLPSRRLTGDKLGPLR